jgi:hypothetical protein
MVGCPSPYNAAGCNNRRPARAAISGCSRHRPAAPADVRVEAQRVAEIGARCFQLTRCDIVVVDRIEPAHFPGIDPGAKRLCVDAGLADPAARERLGKAMGIGAGDGGMAHPDCWLAQPSWGRPPRSPGETASIARHRPRHARREIGRHIPPLDAEFRMRPVVGGKCECPARHDCRKSIRAFTKPGKALREGLAA